MTDNCIEDNKEFYLCQKEELKENYSKPAIFRLKILFLLLIHEDKILKTHGYNTFILL